MRDEISPAWAKRIEIKKHIDFIKDSINKQHTYGQKGLITILGEIVVCLEKLNNENPSHTV